MPLRGEKVLRHAHKPGPWYLCISFRTTAHREWSTLVTARLPVTRFTILDRLVLLYFPIFKLYSTKAYVFFSFHLEYHPFLSRNRHTRSQLLKHSICFFFDEVALAFKSIKMSKCGGDALKKKLTEPEKKYESEETLSDSLNDRQCRN